MKKEKKSILRHIPLLITLMNLLSGFLSIMLISKSKYLFGVLVLFACFIFDLLDGLVARKFGWQSKIGVELDSLADVVSFVIAPAFLVYSLFFSNKMIGMLVAFFAVCCGTLRLAKFNITKDEGYFEGMSTPYFTAIIISFYFIFFYNSSLKPNNMFLAITITAMSYLMISRIRFPSLKKKIFLNFKYVGVGIMAFFALGFFFGINLRYLSFFVQFSYLLFILIPLIFNKLVLRRVFVLLFISFYLMLMVLSDFVINSLSLMIAFPFLYSVIFSPLVQMSFSRPK